MQSVKVGAVSISGVAVGSLTLSWDQVGMLFDLLRRHVREAGTRLEERERRREDSITRLENAITEVEGGIPFIRELSVPVDEEEIISTSEIMKQIEEIEKSSFVSLMTAKELGLWKSLLELRGDRELALQAESKGGKNGWPVGH